jgi:hypothetical protein
MHTQTIETVARKRCGVTIKVLCNITALRPVTIKSSISIPMLPLLLLLLMKSKLSSSFGFPSLSYRPSRKDILFGKGEMENIIHKMILY